MSTVARNVLFSLSIQPRSLAGQALDLTPYLIAVHRSKPIDGQSVGSWRATLKLHLLSDTERALDRVLQGNVEDDDPGRLDLIEYLADGSVVLSPMELMVEGKTSNLMVDQRGTELRIWTFYGQDWARQMTISQTRLSAIFQSTSTEYVQSAAGIEEVRSTIVPQRMPGFIDTKTWERFSKIVTEGASGKGNASATLKQLLSTMLWGLWKQPGTNGKTLVQRLQAHRWQNFGPVDGSPWQLAQITTQTAITPDQVLRQFGCEAYNEIFYDYAGTEPAIVYRERPYGPAAWSRLPVATLTSDQVLNIQAGQSGHERYTMWKPMAAAVSLSGADLMLDTAEGKIPIVDLPDIKNHGVQPFEATDDFFPPISTPNSQFFEWYRIRIGKARRWFYNNHKLLTGTVTIKPADPSVRIGARIRFPFEWTFNHGTQRAPDLRTTPVIEAYVTAVTDTLELDERGTATTVTTVQFTRGQPPGGIAIPAVTPWTKGAKVVQTRSKLAEGAIILQLVQYAVPFRVAWKFTDLRAQITLQPAEVAAGITQIMIGETGTGSSAATRIMYNQRAQTCHFEVDTGGNITQYLDPLSHYALVPDGSGGSLQMPQTVCIDLTGGGDIRFTPTQLAAAAKLVNTLQAHFGTIPTITYVYRPSGLTLEEWRTDQGIDPGHITGIVATNQLVEISTAPSAPADSDATWEKIRALV